MPNITINEISQNYTYNVGANSYATIAIPITAAWGPALTQQDITTSGINTVAGLASTSKDIMQKFEDVQWLHFPSTPDGMNSFVSTYRGPASNYKSAKDYSYQIAMTYLAAGYDILVCRVASGVEAQIQYRLEWSESAHSTVTFKAKYQGTFGNNLAISFKSAPLKTVSGTTYYYYNAIVYIKDATTGSMTAVENLYFVFDQNYETDNIPYYEDINSKYLNISISDPIPATVSVNNGQPVSLICANGKDCFDVPASSEIATVMGTADFGATNYATTRYSLARVIVGDAAYTGFPTVGGESAFATYVQKLFGMSYAPSSGSGTSYLPTDPSVANIIRCNEFNYTAAFIAYTFLMDKLNYAPQRIASPGWDDQNFHNLKFSESGYTWRIDVVSPLHRKIMEVSYYSRCACGMLDVPKSCPRKYVSSTTADSEGYAQLLTNDRLSSAYIDADGALYPTHAALFAPWGKFKYIGTGKAVTAPASFLAMMIQRAMILNQAVQYEWELPTNRTHTLSIGELDYKVPKHILDSWQASSGVSVNAITEIPGQGVTVWGNATLFDVPPATYNALQNLSTRYLIDAVKNVIYRCGIGITFQYNNQQAYSQFYSGVSPILDTMRSVGAIDGYYINMAADINGMDQVNANSVIGQVVLIVNGVITDITIDLIALPPGADITQFQQ